jgi:hypothetical protein
MSRCRTASDRVRPVVNGKLALRLFQVAAYGLLAKMERQSNLAEPCPCGDEPQHGQLPGRQTRTRADHAWVEIGKLLETQHRKARSGMDDHAHAAGEET